MQKQISDIVANNPSIAIYLLEKTNGRKEIANKEVVEEIRKEIERLSK